MDEVKTNRPGSKKPLVFIVLLVVVAVSAYLGYWYGTTNGRTTGSKSPGYIGLDTKGLKLGPDSIVRSQQAVAAGKVERVEASGVTVSGSDGRVGAFRFADTVDIYPPTSSVSGAIKPSNNVQDIKVGEKVILSLTLQGTEYKVTSVSYLPKGTNLK